MHPVQQQKEPWFGALSLGCLVWFSLARCHMSWLCHCTNPHCHHSCNNCSQSRTWAGQKPTSLGSALLFSVTAVDLAPYVLLQQLECVHIESRGWARYHEYQCNCIRLWWPQLLCEFAIQPAEMSLHPANKSFSMFGPLNHNLELLVIKYQLRRIQSWSHWKSVQSRCNCYQCWAEVGWGVCVGFFMGLCPPSSLLFTCLRLIAVFILVVVVYESPVSR